jgi:inorganic pyrophosphatase
LTPLPVQEFSLSCAVQGRNPNRAVTFTNAMANIAALSPQLNAESFECVCVIETPKNSRRKYRLDEASGLFRLAHTLPEGLNFPFDFGFIPSTRAGDGDPIDVLVLADEPAAVGTMIDIRIVGVIHAEETEGRDTVENDRLLAIPLRAHDHQKIRNIREIDQSILDQIENFFLSYTRLQKKQFRIKGCSGPKQALKLVVDAMAAFKKDNE